MADFDINTSNSGNADPEAESFLDHDEHDPLAACLEIVAREYSQPYSKAAALSSLPLINGQLTIGLFPRAAEKLGLSARLVKRSLYRVPSLFVPFVVIFASNEYCVVLDKDKKHKTATVVFPSISDDRQTVKISELEAESSGYLFYIARSEQAETAQHNAGQSERSASHWFWSTVRAYWPAWVQVFVTAFIVNVLGLAFPLFVMNVYDRVIPNLAMPTLWALAAGVVIALLFDFFLKQLRALLLDRAGRRVDIKIAAMLFEQAMGISMEDRTVKTGTIANLIREFETVRDFFTSTSIVAATDLLFIGIFLWVLWLIVGPIAYVPLIAVPIVLVITFLIQIPLSQSVKLTQNFASRRHSILIEGLVGVEAIKALGAEGVMQRRWEDAVAATARTNSSTRGWSSLAIYTTTTIQQIVGVLVIIFGVFLVADGLITVGGLIAASILSGRILAPLGNITMTLARAQQAISAMREITTFMKLRRERSGEGVSSPVIEAGTIEFRDVSFAYPNAQTWALKDIKFSIGAGEKVGIIGRVGSGKSTIGRLIIGLYNPQQGAILLDGADSRSYDPAELRTGVGFVSQDPELFAGSLRDNIILGKPNATERQIAEAVRISGIGAFAAKHPLGLGMPIGERGQGLSGGQRQAVSLARMLLRKPKILFLDEPSSAMDPNTETDLINSLDSWARDDHTLVICTHRISILALVERLLVIEDGKLAADGSKENILEILRKNSIGNVESINERARN